MKMIGKIFLGLLSCAALTLVAEEIEWDFSKGIKPNGPFEFKLLKQATIENGFLYIKDPKIDRMTVSGLKAVKKYPALTPKGAFKISFVFTMEPGRSPFYYLMLWDSKGDYYDKKNGKPLDNSGFTVAIYRTKKDAKVMQVCAWLGNGTKTDSLRSKRISFVTGKKYTLDFEYDGVKKYKFTLDNKEIGAGNVKHGGPLGPAIYIPTIGNRAVGSYFPFDGKIYSVKLLKK